MNIPSNNFTSSPVISMEDSKTPKTGSEPNSPRSHRHNMSSLSRLGWNDKESLHVSLDPALSAQESQMTETSSLTNLAQNKEHDEYATVTCNNDGDNLVRTNNKNSNSITVQVEGPNLTVCVDCKEMILQVIRAQSTARRIKMAKSLFDEAGEVQNNESFTNSDVWGEEFF